MGSLSHHQAKAQEFLQRADRAITTRDPGPAAVALRRAATHMTTALAVHQGWKHKSRRQLETVLHVNIAAETLSRSHLKTLRQAHTLAANQTAVVTKPPLPCGRNVRLGRKRAGVRGNSEIPHPANPAAGPPLEDHPCKTQVRRMRRRVASLINHTRHLIAGKPKPVQHHKLWLRKPDLPEAPDFTSVQDILQLPNFEEMRQKFRLFRAPLAAEPDPHGWYERGDIPRRCRCHAELWEKPQDPHRITLSPLWQRALEKTFRIKLPDVLTLRC